MADHGTSRILGAMRIPVTAAALIALILAVPAATAGDAPESLTGVDLRGEHADRRAALAAVLPPGSIALCPALPHDPWSTFSIRPDENFLWLTGLDESNGILLVSPPRRKGAERGELLLLPARNARMENWIGPRAYPGKEAEESLGVAATADVRELETVLAERLRGVKTVYLPRRGPAAEHVEKLAGAFLEKAKVALEDLAPVLGQLRLRKSPEELARIRRSAELSAEGHVRAIRATRAGMAEYEIQAVMEAACRAGGARRQAYDSIVGSGPNSCVLHYGRNRRILEDGDLVLMDAGAEMLGYACDVTRTWPVGARFSEEQARAYDVVLAAQAAGIEAAKPGATFKDITRACRKVIDDAGYGDAWAHGPCHWVGLGVHDPNGDNPLEPGVVFVIEPGLYFPGKGFGIRIEDTFAMAEDGTLDCLSAGVPKERKAIEALRAEGLATTPR